MDAEKDLRTNIYYFTSELVYYHLKSKPDLTIAKLAEQIDISISFLNKALQSSEGKHFNIRHLFLIANAMEVEISDLLPSKYNYRLLTGKEPTADEWEQIIENYKKGKDDLHD